MQIGDIVVLKKGKSDWVEHFKHKGIYFPFKIERMDKCYGNFDRCASYARGECFGRINNTCFGYGGEFLIELQKPSDWDPQNNKD